jgi:hypothetical protein
MIGCEDVKLWMVERLYDEIDERKADLLREHFRSCAACRAEWDALQQTTAWMSAWQEPAMNAGPVFIPARLSWWSDVKRHLLTGSGSGSRLALALGTAVLLVFVTLAALHTRITYSDGKWQMNLSMKTENAALPPGAVVLTRQEFMDMEQRHVQLLQTVIAQSESRQQKQWSTALKQVLKTIDQKRTQDLHLVSLGMEELQVQTATRLALTDQVLNEMVKYAYGEQAPTQ